VPSLTTPLWGSGGTCDLFSPLQSWSSAFLAAGIQPGLSHKPLRLRNGLNLGCPAWSHLVFLKLAQCPHCTQMPAGAAAVRQRVHNLLDGHHTLGSGGWGPHGRGSIGDPGAPVILQDSTDMRGHPEKPSCTHQRPTMATPAEHAQPKSLPFLPWGSLISPPHPTLDPVLFFQAQSLQQLPPSSAEPTESSPATRFQAQRLLRASQDCSWTLGGRGRGRPPMGEGDLGEFPPR
jgi:hypothetical protein